MNRPLNKRFFGINGPRKIRVSHYRRSTGPELTGTNTIGIMSQRSSNRFIITDTVGGWTETLRLVDKPEGSLLPGEFRVSAMTEEGQTLNVLQFFNRKLIVTGPIASPWDISANVISIGRAPATSIPTIITIPVITGTAQGGQTLTASNDTWMNNPTSFAYQWRRDGINIIGATSSSYFLIPEDVGAVITVQVTAINSAGSSIPAMSIATSAVIAGASLFDQIVALSTTAGVPAGTTLLVPGVNFQAGMNVAGNTVYLDAGAENLGSPGFGWDFRGFTVVPRVTVNVIRNSFFGGRVDALQGFGIDFPTGGGAGVILLMEYCTSDSMPGWRPGIAHQPIFERYSADGMFGHVVHQRFNKYINAKTDYLKGGGSARPGGQIIEWCEFTPGSDLPTAIPGTWSAGTTYAAGAHVVDLARNNRDMISRVDGNVGNLVPTGTTDTAFWDVLDPHLDLISPTQCRWNGLTISRNKIGGTTYPYRTSGINNIIRIGGNSTESIFNAPLAVNENIMLHDGTTWNTLHVGEARSPDFSGAVSFTGNWIKAAATSILYTDSEGYISTWTGNVDFDTLAPINITGQTVVPITITTEAVLTTTDNGATVTYGFRDPVPAVSSNPNPVVLRTLTVDGVTIPAGSITNISGNWTYTVTKGASTHAVLMTYSIRHGRSPALARTLSATTPAAAAAVPVNTAVPVISGSIFIGQTLTAINDTWSNGPILSRTYQWRSGGIAVGTDANTYTLLESDRGRVITVEVIAANSSGSSSPATSVASVAVTEAPAVWSVWSQNNTAISQLSPSTMSSAFVTTPFMGGNGYIDLNTNKLKLTAALIRQATFVVPTAPSIADTDLLVTTFEHPGPMLNGVGGVNLSVGSFSYAVPDAAVPNQYSPGVTQATGRIVNSVQVGHLRNGGWGGPTFQTAVQGSTQQLQLTQMASDLHTQANLRIGPIYRVTSTPVPSVCLTFDDQGSAQFSNLFPIMQELNLVGNVFVDIAAINTTGRFSYANAITMQNAGWSFNLDSSSPVTSEGTIAAKLAWMTSAAATIRANGLGTDDTMKYFRYSWGANAHPINSIARSLTATGSNILTGAGLNASGIAQGAIIKGNVLDGGADVVVVRPVSDSQIEVSRTVAAETYPNARICAIEANRTLASDGSVIVTGIDTRGITVGMLVVGTGIPDGTTVVNIITDSATGSLTLSAALTGVTSATFYLAGSEWLRGSFMDAAYAAGYRAGFAVSSPGSGMYTGMGIPNPRNLMGIPTFPWEDSEANPSVPTSASTIFNLQQLIRNKRDFFPNHHWTNTFAGVPARVANARASLEFIAARRDAGEINVITIDQWYNRVIARSFPA